MTGYERMRYPHDRREWVKMVDDQLPGMIELAVEAQRSAADMFRYWDSLSWELKAKQPNFLSIMRDINHTAHRSLLRVIYYIGMREANR